jgi:uncharacterized protein YjbJ (UPF0337 family)
MNRDILEGKWTQLKGQVKEQWGRLTDDDLDQVAGQTDQLVGKLQERYGLAKDAAEHQIDEWYARTVTPEVQRGGAGRI